MSCDCVETGDEVDRKHKLVRFEADKKTQSIWIGEELCELSLNYFWRNDRIVMRKRRLMKREVQNHQINYW